MLLFINILDVYEYLGAAFQYISCYSLSLFISFLSCCLTAFQYISCYSLSQLRANCFAAFSVSIHLMLLFIFQFCSSFLVFPSFQYISCYSLSGPHSPLQLKISGFNTSHVTLYLDRGDINIRCVVKFQYISCYSLSLVL